ncbi:MAG: tyrosine-type recombinase/integrase [Alphaproteobacteria bacterium]|nr:tyrosine-type recombinase/integrase [Alphaproteobacteria bacterium]
MVISLPGQPGEAAFHDALARAMEATIGAGEGRAKPGSVRAIILAYFQSADFKLLRASSASVTRRILESFCKQHGDKPLALMQPAHVRSILDKMSGTPHAANNLLKKLRVACRWAIARALLTSDPTSGVKPLRVRSEGFKNWSESDIAQFEAAHPSGTRARLAFALLLYTGQRRGDVVKIGRQHAKDGALVLTQEKTGRRLSIPIVEPLRQELEGPAAGPMTYLVTHTGAPFSGPGFTNWFRECVRAANLPAGLSAHGLRKAASRRLAEAGCTPHQIAAITGHATLGEVERYTRASDQARLAISAAPALLRRNENE